MPASPIYEAFKRAHCKELELHAELCWGKGVLSEVTKRLGLKRLAGQWYQGAYPGERKERILVDAYFYGLDKSPFELRIWWYKRSGDLSTESIPFKKLVDAIGKDFGDREVFARATFWYSSKEAESLFKPIDLLGQPAILDSITGFTGVKKNPEGKLVYRLEVSFEPEGVRHVVIFTQTVKLSEGTPLLLVETASKISALALKPKER